MGKNTRAEQKQRRRQKLLYPFNRTTKIADFVGNRHYGCVARLVSTLRPYLTDEDRMTPPFLLTRLYFNLEHLSRYSREEVVMPPLAQFLVEAREGMKHPQSVFIRYLSHPDHCNLGISEESLKALILKAKRKIR